MEDKVYIEKKPLMIAVCAFVAAIAFAIALGLIVRACNKPPEKVYSTDDFKYESDIDGVKDVLNTNDEKYLVLVNKQNGVEDGHTPDNLTDISSEYATREGIQLEENAAKAAMALIDEMRKAGFNTIAITSGYRTYQYQENLYNRYYNQTKEKHPEWSEKEIQDHVYLYSAPPGTSEHHTGLCMDLYITDKMLDLVNYGDETDGSPYDIGFAESDEYVWLKDNAHKFGFILRYPDEKTDITGYIFESWHYRFVGVNVATKIYNEGITLEEYLKD